MREVWIVQPYLPRYRVPFFDGLRATLADHGIKMTVVAGTPSRAQAARGDSQKPMWLVPARDRKLMLAGRTITLTSTRRHWRGADAVIVPHMGSSLDALSASFRRHGELKVGVWGHIAAYTSPPNPLDAAIERAQLKAADHVFAYTAGGADFAKTVGVDPGRTTTVMNSFDTAELALDIANATDADVSALLDEYGIRDRTVVAYIGGLDASKRVDFLADALDELHSIGSRVHVLVGGAGEDIWRLQNAEHRGQVTLLGVVGGPRKATVLRSAAAIVNPGRVGLVAVDALVAGTPIVTTDWPFHAPELEYLTEGVSLFRLADDPREYARQLDAVVRRNGIGQIMAERAHPRWTYPTLDSMVANFAGGVLTMLDAPSVRITKRAGRQSAVGPAVDKQEETPRQWI